MRLPIALVAAISVGALLLAACGGSGDDGPTVSGELHIYNWDDYFGETTLEDFTAEYGIEVFLDIFTDENEMLSVIASDTSRYDLFISSDSVIAEMAAEKLLAELDHENIPNLANIDPVYLDLPTDPGNKYSVPYDWGTTGIVYNSTCVEPDEESWGLLMDPQVANRVAMDSDYTVVIGTMLKYRGYSLNSHDKEELNEIVSLLVDMQSSQGVQFLSWDVILDELASGELCAGQVFNGDAVWRIADNEDLEYFTPQEGSDIYLDSLAIPRDAMNKAAAELFINYVLRPDVHAAITDYTGYANPNQASIDQGYVDSEHLSNPISYPDTDLLEAWIPFTPAVRAAWNAAWADVQRAAAAAASQ